MPVVLLSSAEQAEVLLECLVGALAGAISLGMIGCGYVLVDVEELA